MKPALYSIVPTIRSSKLNLIIQQPAVLLLQELLQPELQLLLLISYENDVSYLPS